MQMQMKHPCGIHAPAPNADTLWTLACRIHERVKCSMNFLTSPFLFVPVMMIWQCEHAAEQEIDLPLEASSSMIESALKFPLHAGSAFSNLAVEVASAGVVWFPFMMMYLTTPLCVHFTSTSTGVADVVCI